MAIIPIDVLMIVELGGMPMPLDIANCVILYVISAFRQHLHAPPAIIPKIECCREPAVSVTCQEGSMMMELAKSVWPVTIAVVLAQVRQLANAYLAKVHKSVH